MVGRGWGWGWGDGWGGGVVVVVVAGGPSVEKAPVDIVGLKSSLSGVEGKGLSTAWFYFPFGI